MGSGVTNQSNRRGRKSADSGRSTNSTRTGADSAAASTSGTDQAANGASPLNVGDRVIVKYAGKHALGKITRTETLAVDYIEYRCDYNAGLHLARREHVKRLKTKN